MNNILILGASGFIGKHLIKRFNKNNEIEGNITNICIIRYEYDYKNYLNPTSIDFCNLQLTKIQDIKNLISENNIGSIVHLASGLIPTSSKAEFEIELKNLIEPSYELFSFASKLNIKTLFMSSGGTIYGNNNMPAEEDELNPLNFYGKSKLLLESYIRSLDSITFKYNILRPSNVYGTYFNINKKQGLISNVINSIAKNKSISVWGDGSAVRDYIHVDNLVDVILTFLEQDILVGSYNIGAGVGHSVVDVIQIVEHCFGKKAAIEFFDNKYEGLKTNILNISKLQSVTEYKPYDLQYGIQKTIQSLKL